MTGSKLYSQYEILFPASQTLLPLFYVLSFSHLFPGSQETDINMSSVIVSLQLLHSLQDNNRVMDVINVIHEGYCQQTDL